MDKVITIDGRTVKFRATAAIPRLYRIAFNRDIVQDVNRIQAEMDKVKKGETSLPPEALTLFENVAFIMARHGDRESVPEDVGEWLDGFETFSIYMVFPELMELWEANMKTTVTSKKNFVPRRGK